MKKKAITVLLIMETLLLLAGLLGNRFYYDIRQVKTEVYRQSSEDGSQTVVIYELGEPDWPFGRAHYEVNGPSDFAVDVSDDGGRGTFTVTWKERSVVIIFSGSEQKDAVYELPFQ